MNERHQRLIMDHSICQDKDFFYLADAIDTSPRAQTPPPFLYTPSITSNHNTIGSDPYLESPEDYRPRAWNPDWPSRAEWARKLELDYLALSLSQRVKADYYRARSDRYKQEMRAEANIRYRGSLTLEELEQTLDKFQTLLPPAHIPGMNVRRVGASTTPRDADPCITPFSNHLANRQAGTSPVPTTPVSDHDPRATPRMTRKSSTLESFLTFMTPKTFDSIRRRKERKLGKAAFSVL